MKKQSKSTEAKPTQKNRSNVRARQRGIGVLELLFTAASIGSTVLVAAMNSSKKPPGSGD